MNSKSKIPAAAPLDPDEPETSESLAGTLAAALTPIAPEPARALAMRERLIARARASGAQALHRITVRREEGQWRRVVDGVRVKLLHEVGSTRSVLVELDPGASLPVHRHLEREECVVLRGETQLGDLRLHHGDYHVAPAGSRHDRVSSPTGALVYLRGVSLGDTFEVARSMISAWLPGRGKEPVTVRAEEGAWADVQPGVQAKPLWIEGERQSILIRMQPGSSLPAAHEECVMIEGEAFVGDTLLRAGEYQFAPDGAVGGTITSDVGALLFVHGASTAGPRSR
jgi:anti-sigma factor ChrR (cupin superfamily)